jgi:cell wall-associated NlpC family hydrolase
MTLEQRKDLVGRTLTQVLFGDTVLVEEVARGWARIIAVGQAAPDLDPRGYPGWVPAAHIAPALDRPDPAPVPGPMRSPTAQDVLQTALSLEGVPYIWGGLSPYGIDCSGLVHLAHRRLGVTVPRDAADQANASRPVEPGTEAPGDLCFFSAPGGTIDHVGFVVSPGRLLHAPGSGSQVRQDPIEGPLARRLTSIHRTLP